MMIGILEAGGGERKAGFEVVCEPDGCFYRARREGLCDRSCVMTMSDGRRGYFCGIIWAARQPGAVGGEDKEVQQPRRRRLSLGALLRSLTVPGAFPDA